MEWKDRPTKTKAVEAHNSICTRCKPYNAAMEAFTCVFNQFIRPIARIASALYDAIDEDVKVWKGSMVPS